MTEQPFYRECLAKAFERRKGYNPHLSHRGFARELGISSPMLIQVMSGKRKLSFDMAVRLADRLALSAEEARRFLASVLLTSLKHAKERTYVEGLLP